MVFDIFLTRIQGAATNPTIRKDPSEGEESRNDSGSKPNNRCGGNQRAANVEQAEMIASHHSPSHLSLYMFSAHRIRILYVFNTVVYRFRRPSDSLDIIVV